MVRTRNKLTERRCANCDRKFTAKSSKALYCGAACKQAAYRKRLTQIFKV